MSGAVAVRVLRDNQGIRRITVGHAGHALAEHATWLAIMVWAYQRGGVAEAGLAAAIQLVPAGIMAPLLSVATDRLPRERVLAGGVLSVSVSLGLTGSAMIADGPAPLVYACAVAAAVLMTIARPATSALLPSVAASPEQLTAGNVWFGNAKNFGLFAGPATAGIMLAVTGPGSIFLAMSGVTCAAAIVLFGVQPGRRDAHAHLDDDEPVTLATVTAGLRLLRDQPAPRLLVSILMVTAALAGAMDVAFAAIAVEVLGRSEAGAGLLAVAAGIGSLAGGFASVTLIGRLRLSMPFAISVAVGTVPIALVGMTSSTALACLLLAMSGAGLALSEVAGRTMIQGLAPDDTLARVFGLLEGATLLAIALGGASFSAIAVGLGLRTALIVTGLGLPLVGGVGWRSLRRIDRDRQPVAPEVLAAVTAHPIFAVLPAYAVEQLVHRFTQHDFEPGTAVMTEGDEGRDFHLAIGGTAEISIAGRRVRTAGVGEGLGEIALLHRSSRTATVTAGTQGLRTLRLDRDDFVEAVTGVPRSLSRANSIAADHLAASDEP